MACRSRRSYAIGPSLQLTPYLILSNCVTTLCAECLADMQARAQAAEEALAAANTAAEGERFALQGQVDESRTVVGQWKEAYEKLQSQYEVIQVSPCVQKGCVTQLMRTVHTVFTPFNA